MGASSPPAARLSRAISTFGPVLALAATAAWLGCASPSPRNVADQRVVDMEVAPPEREQIDHTPPYSHLLELEREPQPDGEEYGGVRTPIPDFYKEFLQQRVFGYGEHTVRLELPPQDEGSIVAPIFWINPVDIPREHLYGSDVTLITDPHFRRYSPRDLEAINTGRTVTVVPLGLHRDHLSGGQRIDALPGETLVQRRVPILTTHAYVRGLPAYEADRDHLGYLLKPKVYNPETLQEEQLSIYYAGPVSGEAMEAMPYRADILIVPTAPPSRISAEEIVAFARQVEAEVIVALGRDSAEGAEVINELTRIADIPLWLPPQAPPRPDVQPESPPEPEG